MSSKKVGIIKRSLKEHDFLLLVFDDMNYENKILEIVSELCKNHKICYVCSSRPYGDLVEEFKSSKIDITKFVFIDLLSTYYKDKRNTARCIFLPVLSDIATLSKTIQTLVQEKDCTVVILDSISSLLKFHSKDNLIRLAHSMSYELDFSKNKKLFFVNKDINKAVNPYVERLLQDLVLFADKKIEYQ